MPLNLDRRSNSNSNSSRDFVSGLRYAARTNVWSTWDAIAKGMIDLPEVAATFDFQNIFTGWMRFAQGEKPDFVWDIDGKAEPRPSKDYKRGFSVYLWLPDFGLHELCSSSPGLCEAINIAFDEYERAREAAQGLLPILQTGEAKSIESSFGIFWEPSFEIVGWEPRPQGLPARTALKSTAPASGATVSSYTAVAYCGRRLCPSRFGR